jgi:long-chain fatty acid transport protein
MMTRRLTALAVGAALSALTTSAIGGGFGIGTQSGSGTGNAFAGGAAAADDASVAWHNPAAMTLLPGKQVGVALHALKPSFKYQDQGSTLTYAAQPPGNGGDGGDWAFVPNGFFTMAVNPRVSIGVALNAPFGLKTEYERPWRGQLTGVKSEIKTVNLNPSIAYKLSDALSIGAGISYQRIEAELSTCGDVACANFVNLSADDDGWGYNLGLVFQATPETRIGATYRSSIKYDLEGTVTLSAAPIGNGGITAEIRVPDSLSFSVFHKLNPKWELMGDITWTGWSSVQHLPIFRTTTTPIGAAGTLFGTPLLFRWDDTLRYSVGANYRVSDQMKLRFGLALDETPTNDADRTPRLPDEERTWLAFGMQYRVSKAGVLDLGYAHEFIKDASVNVPVPGFTTCAAGCLRGSFENKADIFSVQYSHSF